MSLAVSATIGEGERKGLCCRRVRLKGGNMIAQGNALGTQFNIRPSALKGRNKITDGTPPDNRFPTIVQASSNSMNDSSGIESFCFALTGLPAEFSIFPRALPWAGLLWPFRPDETLRATLLLFLACEDGAIIFSPHPPPAPPLRRGEWYALADCKFTLPDTSASTPARVWTCQPGAGVL